MRAKQREINIRAALCGLAGLGIVIASALMLTACDRSGDATASNADQTNAHASAAEASAPRQSPLDASYEKVLSQVVDEDGLVRYAAFKSDALRNALDDVVAGFAAATLPDASASGARKAFWLNALNANALKMAYAASQTNGFKSVNDVPGFFTSSSITVAGEATTLDGLRTMIRNLKDPRVHAAMVVGTMTSPALRNECYAADRIDAQLDAQAKTWFDNRGLNRTTRSELLLSPLFETYGVDFKVQPYDGVMGFVLKHARSGGSLRDFIRGVGGSPPIKFMPYDWSLNNTREMTSLPANP